MARASLVQWPEPIEETGLQIEETGVQIARTSMPDSTRVSPARPDEVLGQRALDDEAKRRGVAGDERLSGGALLIAHGQVEEVAVEGVAKVLPRARSGELGLE